MDKTLREGAYIYLKDVVYNALANMGYGEERFEQFLVFARDLHEELTMDGHHGVKDKKLTMTDYKSIILPQDCIDWVMMGLRVGTEFLVFTNDNNIFKNFESREDAGLLDSDITYEKENYGYYWTEFTHQGDDAGKLFGLKVKDHSAGHFIEDINEGEIYFKSRIFSFTDVYLRYISSGTIDEEEALVHRYERPLYVAYIDWKAHEHSGDPNKYRLAERKRELYNMEMDKYLSRKTNWTLDDIKEVLYDSFTTVPSY